MVKTKKLLLMSSFVTLVLWMNTTKRDVNLWFESAAMLLDKTFGTEMAKKPYPYANIKYILQWTKSYTEPFVFMGRGQNTFIKRRCSVNNCFITADKSLLNTVKNFDAILFHGPELTKELIRFPGGRSARQKYVYVSAESSDMYPINYNFYDTYFNWTWTYKLNSDIYFGYVIIKNKEEDIIGPKEVMHWLKVEEMKPIDYKLKQKLSSKRTAAAWFVSHCKVKSGRGEVAKLLQKELAKYNMTVDIYGICGNKYCPRSHMRHCLRYLESEYYFYLSFENTISEDYVTEKLLHALQHYTVPIVYGGANYTRFMPDGTYLIAKTNNIEELVQQMVEIINDKEKYYDFFRWTNHYSYHYAEQFPETDSYCNFCSKLNDANSMKERSNYNDFRLWWNSN